MAGVPKAWRTCLSLSGGRIATCLGMPAPNIENGISLAAPMRLSSFTKASSRASGVLTSSVLVFLPQPCESRRLCGSLGAVCACQPPPSQPAAKARDISAIVQADLATGIFFFF
eukprot:scaffold13553_cov80-Phaeocystis_antarctica.AAC.4